MTPQSAPQPLSEIGRLTGVFFEPRRTFADIAVRPRWWTPLILITLAALTMIYFFSQRVGWDSFMHQKMESNKQIQSMPADQRERIIEQQAKVAGAFGYVGAAVGVAVYALIVSGVLLFVFKLLMGAELTFKQMLAISCYSFVPGLLNTGAALAVLFLKNPEEFNLENPTAFNVGAYLDAETTPKWMMSLASSLDLFVIWTIVLLALGVSVAAKRIAFGRALVGVISAWLVWVVLKTAASPMFS